MARFVDYYHILGVRPQATREDIERVYRGMARSSLLSDRVHEAYGILSDPVKRRRYDTVDYRYRNLDRLLRKEGIIRERTKPGKAHPKLTCSTTQRTATKRKYTLTERIGIYVSTIVAAGIIAIPMGLGIRGMIGEGHAEDPSTLEMKAETKHDFTETHYRKLVKEAAKKEKIEPCLAHAIYETEYVGAFYISETGAIGVMELMPREGSYTTTNYENYQKARKTKERTYQGTSAKKWAAAYVEDLARMAKPFIDKKDYDGLYAKDSRFNPEWNIPKGVRELAVAFHHFEAKGHLVHDASLLAMAAYNGGIPAVERGEDHIPTTTQGFVDYAAERWELCRK